MDSPSSRKTRNSKVRIPPPHQNVRWKPNESLDEHDGFTFTPLTTNLWTPGKFPDWKKPAGWFGQWPWDPTAIQQGFKQCDLCAEPLCDCITTRLCTAIPAIVDAGVMGQGVDATVAYKVGDNLGELIGEIVPLDDDRDDGWSAQVKRFDLRGSPAVCKINTRRMGNWGRKVNHSCEPNVQLVCRPVSGKWRILFEVTHPIESGQAILIHYGDDYFKDGGIKCLCGTASCLENDGHEESRVE